MSDEMPEAGCSVADYVRAADANRRVSNARRSAKYLLTLILLPIERRRAARILAQSDRIRLHLGCGDDYKPGWTNLDLARPGRTLDLQWDLRRGLPFPPSSVDAVFAQHLLEHMPYGAGLSLISECLRVLRPEGVLRVVVPDLGNYIASYSGSSSVLDDMRPGRPSRAIALSEIFYHYGHQAAYDYATLQLLCSEAGFPYVVRSSFGGGVLGTEMDDPARQIESLYVEARA